MNNTKSQIEQAMKRTDLTADQKATLDRALARLNKFAANFRKVTDITREIADLTRPAGGSGGGGGLGRFGVGGAQAEPGAYFVKLTVDGKTTTSRIVVRPDPIQAGQ